MFLVEPAGADVALVGVEPDGCDPEVVGGDAFGLVQQGLGDGAAVPVEAHVALGEVGGRQARDPEGGIRQEVVAGHHEQVAVEAFAGLVHEDDVQWRIQVGAEPLGAEVFLDENRDVLVGDLGRTGHREGFRGQHGERLHVRLLRGTHPGFAHGSTG